ncbi:MAG TPA: AgmX/PglI C-terminal domain-containing protein [Polyangia bacterium]|nr:AgmX/PglI C-terminal domain-containing protein [Polyangia bacterium]
MSAQTRRCVRPDRLAQLARKPLGADEQRHVDGCAACTRALGRVRAAQSALSFASESLPPDPSAAALVRAEASIRWARIAPEPRLRPRFIYGFAAAAVGAAVLAFATRDVTKAPLRAPMRVAHELKVPVQTSPLQALVTLVGGDVRLRRAGAAGPLGIEANLGAGDHVATSGSARVAAQWSEGSGFLLFADSELALTRLEARKQRLYLDHGKIAVRVGPHDQAGIPLAARPAGPTRESLQVITPDHIISVHGTWFSVASAQHVTTVEVLEGTVEVTERDGSSSTLLTAPTRAVFGRGRATTAAMTTHEAARLRTASEMNLMAWSGLDAARAASGALHVDSQPASATLAVDGVEEGATPLTIRRPLGRHYIELSRADFATQHQWVAIGPETGELRVALVHAAPAPDPDSVPIEIESMVYRRATQIRACYERRLKRDPSLAGTVSLRLRVGDAGQVTRVDVEGSTLPDPLVAECLRREAAGWSFSQGRNATVVYPFVFRTQ